MDSSIPPGMEKEHAELLWQIYDAFGGVSREGGVSWSETAALDDYGSDAERLRARARDTDRDWTELVDDPGWPVMDRRGLGGVSFLDAIGFRYYLPVLMLRELAGEHAVTSLAFHLTLGEGEWIEYDHKKWALLDAEQRRCVQRFLRYMIALDHARGSSDSSWAKPLYSYWEYVE